MKRETLKTEILNILDKVPESKLEEIYQLLTSHAEIDTEGDKLAQQLDKILSEDSNLLNRLAQ